MNEIGSQKGIQSVTCKLAGGFDVDPNEWKWFGTLLPPFFLDESKWTMIFKSLRSIQRFEKKSPTLATKRVKRSKGETRVKSPLVASD